MLSICSVVSVYVFGAGWGGGGILVGKGSTIVSLLELTA